ncbi:MAG TPA: DUF3618 domain-containing protein [Xanthobacteraceae bacterium]|nr:DUF3618 domain-containing protein [Xanthobacteraceae bacterium]
MTNSAQLEREAEQTRSQLAQTLDELRERITPGQLMDQVVDYARDSGGGDFARNLGRQVSANPVPVCLMAAGMAWLMLSGRRASTLAQETGAAVESSVQDLNDQARQAASSVSENVSSAYAAGKEQLASAGEAASRTGSRIAQGTSSATRQTAQATKNFLQFCADQPLILAGFGLALGAALGASLPATETENQLMGEGSDKLKGRAQEFAREQYAKGEEAAQTAAHAVKETAREVAEEVTEPAAEKEPSHAEASLVPESRGRETGGAPREETGEQRHAFVE